LAARSSITGPRGLLTCGPDEPSALVTLRRGARREPNLPATMVELFDGLEAESQNRWPSLAVDLGAVNGLLSPLFSAGFYYKTFMWPAAFWEKVYEPLIRRAAGLGQPGAEPDPDSYESLHHHCDLLVVGSGVAGLSAALAAGGQGARVIVLEQMAELGGGSLVDPALSGWREAALGRLAAMPEVRLLPRTTAIGAYDSGVFAAVERVADHVAVPPEGLPRQRLHTIRAARTILATGATERLIALPGNDLPGVMLASAARAYLHRFGVLPARRLAALVNNDEAYAALRDLAAAGVEFVAIADPRSLTPIAREAKDLGLPVMPEATIARITGFRGVSGVQIGGRMVACDGVLLSGGYTPRTELGTQAGLKTDWRDEIAGFAILNGPVTPSVLASGIAEGEEFEASPSSASQGQSMPGATVGPILPRKGGGGREADGGGAAVEGLPHPSGFACHPPRTGEGSGANLAMLPPHLPHVHAAGAAAGIFGRREAAEHGALLGCSVVDPDFPAPPRRDQAIQPLWEVRGRGKAFVDLQNDVTAEDIRLAHQEGYSHIEHAKRYTTHGMGTDQGRTGGLVGAAILAAARGLPVSAVGVSKPRPFATPASFGALSGGETGAHFKPERRLALHDWHRANGAVFARIGLWMRPLVYSHAGDTSWGPVLEEARAVRRSVGLTDASSLGKIDVQGRDAATFLDRVYANGFSSLPVGRARYGLMLREDGIVLDDGTTARLAPDHFLVTTTTAKADDVLVHLEFHAQTVWPELDVRMVNVADQWAQFAVAGPHARMVLSRVVTGCDVSDAAFPFMAAGEAVIAGVTGRLFRISFSGERAYEVAVPARHALTVWQALLAAGADVGIRPYGLDALNLMRIEKGHSAGSELNGQTSAHDLGLGRMLKTKGDFIGRTLALRPGLTDPMRPQLVGIRPRASGERLRGGMHLVAGPGATRSEGYLTAVCMGAEVEGWLALALLENGRARMGESVLATSPVHGESVECTVVSPHFLDADGSRAKG
jgi:methylglutamate dehydrogenase subunit C